jgi:hypothetical protein
MMPTEMLKQKVVTAHAALKALDIKLDALEDVEARLARATDELDRTTARLAVVEKSFAKSHGKFRWRGKRQSGSTTKPSARSRTSFAPSTRRSPAEAHGHGQNEGWARRNPPRAADQGWVGGRA